MKKNVFFALFACAALAFVGCEEKKPNNPTTGTGDNDSTAVEVVITVNPDTLVLSVGDTEKLNAVVAPTGTQLTVTWASDNESVVTVAPSGIIEAVGVGTANVIASAPGAVADTCLVNVTNDAVFENFAFSGYGFFGDIQYIEGAETDVELVDGSMLHCQMGYVEVGVWDTEVVEVQGNLSGAGHILYADLPMYVIDDNNFAGGQYNGQLVGSGGFIITELPDDSIRPFIGSNCTLVDIDSYAAYCKEYIAYQNDPTVVPNDELYYKAFAGTAEMCYVSFDEQFSTYNTATVKHAEFYDTEEGLGFYAEIDWLDYVNPGRWFGLAVEVNAEGKMVSVVEPYNVRQISKIYTNLELPDNAAAASAKSNLRIIDPSLVHLGMDVHEYLNTHKMYKK